MRHEGARSGAEDPLNRGPQLGEVPDQPVLADQMQVWRRAPMCCTHVAFPVDHDLCMIARGVDVQRDHEGHIADAEEGAEHGLVSAICTLAGLHVLHVGVDGVVAGQTEREGAPHGASELGRERLVGNHHQAVHGGASRRQVDRVEVELQGLALCLVALETVVFVPELQGIVQVPPCVDHQARIDECDLSQAERVPEQLRPDDGDAEQPADLHDAGQEPARDPELLDRVLCLDPQHDGADDVKRATVDDGPDRAILHVGDRGDGSG